MDQSTEEVIAEQIESGKSKPAGGDCDGSTEAIVVDDDQQLGPKSERDRLNELLDLELVRIGWTCSKEEAEIIMV